MSKSNNSGVFVLAHVPNLPRQISSSQALIRFCVRMLILASFAAFGSLGFGKSLTSLLWMAIIFCVAVAIVKREQPLGTALNHWDEMMAYAAVLSLLNVLAQATPN